jgi:alpha-tubulin suppressor-like RCC1 family protein
MALTTQLAMALVVGVAFQGNCNFWRHGHGHGHGNGHGHGHCKDNDHHKDKHGRDCEAECTSDQYETASGDCRVKATAISAGFEYACAVLAGGGLKCWGSDGTWKVLGYAPSTATLGDAPGEMGDALPLVSLGAGLSAIDVYADSDVTCALIEGGGMKCWGYNGYGVATGVPNGSLAGLTVSDYLLHTFSSDAVAIAAGSGTGMALHADGTVSRISAGTGLFSFDGALAVEFDRSSRYDGWDACIVADDGSVRCRGFIEGPASTETIELGTGRTGVDVAMGADHACALIDDGGVKCWGNNGRGQLGQGDTLTREAEPGELGDALAPIALGLPAIAITAGSEHTCAILEGGSVKCWGRNDVGQLGVGSTDDMGDAPGEMAALPAVDLGAGRSAVAIDAGSHTCALLDNGGVKCWGGNARGELGQGDTMARGVSAGQLGDALPEIDLGS